MAIGNNFNMLYSWEMLGDTQRRISSRMRAALFEYAMNWAKMEKYAAGVKYDYEGRILLADGSTREPYAQPVIEKMEIAGRKDELATMYGRFR